MADVWVLEVGEYSGRMVGGVYVSAEAAMVANPDPAWRQESEDHWESPSGDYMSLWRYDLEDAETAPPPPMKDDDGA